MSHSRRKAAKNISLSWFPNFFTISVLKIWGNVVFYVGKHGIKKGWEGKLELSFSLLCVSEFMLFCFCLKSKYSFFPFILSPSLSLICFFRGFSLSLLFLSSSVFLLFVCFLYSFFDNYLSLPSYVLFLFFIYPSRESPTFLNMCIWVSLEGWQQKHL